MMSHHIVTSGDWQTFIHESSPRIEKSEKRPNQVHKEKKDKKRATPRSDRGTRTISGSELLRGFVEPTPADASGTRISFLIATFYQGSQTKLAKSKTKKQKKKEARKSGRGKGKEGINAWASTRNSNFSTRRRPMKLCGCALRFISKAMGSKTLNDMGFKNRPKI